ncbi:hypothetical protein NE865_13258 [Phthorimaea operculella]|nr:hypothetical protein NE865_13258 [Phthorimaea operculella]
MLHRHPLSPEKGLSPFHSVIAALKLANLIMAAKIVVLALAVASCAAGPVWIDGNDYIPGMVVRIGRSPNMAFGFGSGFSSNIGGISHSTSIGSSFGTGDSEAYGGAVAGTGSNGGAYARGVGVANAAPHYPAPQYQQAAASAYNGGFGRSNYGSALSSAHNYGNNFGSAASSARTQNGLQYGAANSVVQNGGHPGFQSAVSSAQTLRGLGSYESSLAAANSAHGLGYGSAVSSAQSNNGLDGYNAAVSSAQNVGGYSGSSSQAVEHRGGSVRHSGASSVNGPGIQAAQSHAVNTGFY